MNIKCLIIAAGCGSRLATKGNSKPLIPLLGLCLIERVILTAKKAGIRDFYIVTGFNGEKVRHFLDSFSKDSNIQITHLLNEKWEEGNGLSVLKAKDLFNENFVLLMADHIFDDRILKGIIKHNTNSSVLLAVDRRKPVPEDTKVLEENRKIVDIGKDIEVSNCIDTGIFFCSPRIFYYIEEAIKEGKTELSDGIGKAAKYGDAEVFDIGKVESYASKMRKDIKPWWIDIDTEEDLREAKKTIIENSSKNPSDILAAYVHKPIENKLVDYISNCNITPNQLTVFVNILAYAATALFLFGHLLSASILSFVVGIADGLDGKLARVKLMTSKVGTLEHSFDMLFEFSWFIALSWFLARSTESSTPLLLCTLIILFVAFYRHVYDQFRKTAGKSLDDYGHFERIFKRVAGRRNLYNIPILVSIILGAPIYSLYFIVLHSGITAITYSLRSIKHLSAIDRG